MASLELRFKKVRDGEVAFTLVRADGSHTTDRIGPERGFGPVHDIAHYVVERALGLSEGFLGLVAAGWSVRDFERKGTAKSLPADAIVAEAIAGAVSFEAMMGARNETAAELAARVGRMLSDAGHAGRMPPLTEEMLNAMREGLAALRQQWDALPPGETLVLQFG